jgi:hypothetical protein
MKMEVIQESTANKSVKQSPGKEKVSSPVTGKAPAAAAKKPAATPAKKP